MSNFLKRVAFVCFSHALGGLELSTLRMADAMRAKGLATWIVAPPSSPLAERARDTNLASISLSPRWKYGDLLAALRLARIIKENEIDLVILVQSKDIHLAAVAAVSSPRTKLVFYQQMQSGHNKRDLAHSWVYSKLALWITLTNRMREDVLTFTRMKPDKVKAAPLGIDVRQFAPSRYPKKEARAFFGLPQEGPIIGVLGRLDRQKGQEVLLRAVPEILGHHPNALFVLAGDETAGEAGYKTHLQSVCRELKVEHSVKFLPFIDDVPRFLSALDLFVLPSFSETFGLVVLEAMAMEKPVIATNAGGVPEIIVDGETGLLVEPRDSKALAHTILRVLSDTHLRASLGSAGRKAVLKDYDFDACIDKLLGLLSTI